MAYIQLGKCTGPRVVLAGLSSIYNPLSPPFSLTLDAILCTQHTTLMPLSGSLAWRKAGLFVKTELLSLGPSKPNLIPTIKPFVNILAEKEYIRNAFLQSVCLYWLLGQYRETLLMSRNSSIDTKSRKRWTSGTVIKVNHPLFSSFLLFSLPSENKENYFFLAKQNPKRRAIEVYPIVAATTTRPLAHVMKQEE